MALKDDPKVQDLLAKAAAKAGKDATKAAAAAAKGAFTEIIGGLEDKGEIKLVKAIQRDVLAALKAVA